VKIINGFRSILYTVLAYAGAYVATDPRHNYNRGKARGRNGTANQVLAGNLPGLRAQCRQLVRNHPTARAVILARCALVVGTGMDVQPDTGTPEYDDMLGADFKEWGKNCGPNGESLYELSRLGYSEDCTVGEGVFRWVRDGRNLKLLPLESEWLNDMRDETMPARDGSMWVRGCRIDAMGRPIQYALTNPAALSLEDEVVSASEILHTLERKRAYQTRGEPLLSSVLVVMGQEEELIQHELAAAKNTAALSFVTTSENGEVDDDAADPLTTLEAGSNARMLPGEDIKAFGHTRPSQQIAPFSLFLRQRIAAAATIPLRFLDREPGRMNFSAMKGDSIDTEMLLKPEIDRYGAQFYGAAYKKVLPILCAKRGIPLQRDNYRLLPDGMPYLDKQKEVAADRDEIALGINTRESIVARRGGDYKQIQTQKNKEDIELALSSIKAIQAIQDACDKSGVPGLTWSHIMTLSGAGSAPGAYLSASVSAPSAEVVAGDVPAGQPAKPQEKQDEDTDEEADDMREEKRHARRVELARAAAPSIVIPSQPITIRNEMPTGPAPLVNVNVPEQSAPVINVAAPAVTIEGARIDAPIVNVNVPQQAAPAVHVAAPQVTVENTIEVPQRTIKAVPQRDGSVLMTPQE
jgi:capsid protein